MYFWKTKEVVRALKQRTLTQHEKMKYFLATCTLYALAFVAAPLGNQTLSIPWLLQSAVIVVLVIAGTLFCYRANRAADDQDFIDRFVCIAWPLTVKIVLIAMVV